MLHRYVAVIFEELMLMKIILILALEQIQKNMCEIKEMLKEIGDKVFNMERSSNLRNEEKTEIDDMLPIKNKTDFDELEDYLCLPEKADFFVSYRIHKLYGNPLYIWYIHPTYTHSGLHNSLMVYMKQPTYTYTVTFK